jgi:hypothetical protein
MNQAIDALRVRVTWVNPVHLFRGLYRLNVHIDNYWLLTAMRDNAAQHLIFRIDLLMRHERWNIDKVARSCFRSEFEMLTPAHTCPTPDDVNGFFSSKGKVRLNLRGARLTLTPPRGGSQAGHTHERLYSKRLTENSGPNNIIA